MSRLTEAVGRLLGTGPVKQRSSGEHEATRIFLEVPVALRISGRKIQARTGNISMGGVFIALKAPPPVGTVVELAIDLGGSAIRGFGEVVWIRRMLSVLGPAGMALDFCDLPGDSRAELRRVLESTDPLPVGDSD